MYNETVEKPLCEMAFIPESRQISHGFSGKRVAAIFPQQKQTSWPPQIGLLQADLCPASLLCSLDGIALPEVDDLFNIVN